MAKTHNVTKQMQAKIMMRLEHEIAAAARFCAKSCSEIRISNKSWVIVGSATEPMITQLSFEILIWEQLFAQKRAAAAAKLNPRTERS